MNEINHNSLLITIKSLVVNLRMNTSLRFTLILLLAAGLSFAQDSTRIGVQSNLASLARPAIPSLNLGLMIEKGRRQYTIELDMGLFTPRS